MRQQSSPRGFQSDELSAYTAQIHVARTRLNGSLFFIFSILAVCFSETLHGQQFVNKAGDYGITAAPLNINFGSGVSFYDFNQDGRDDLSFAMTDDHLVFYQNNGNGFTQVLVDELYMNGETKHVLWVDYDNDGDLDIAIAINFGRYLMYRNNGDFTFTNVSQEIGFANVVERHYGLSFCDYDNDGDLDMYSCVYALDPGNNEYNANNHLYRNNGDGTFTDVSLEAGVADGVKLSFQSVWFDYDEDGWIDLFVINDRLFANSLYRNNGDGTFTNTTNFALVGFAGQDPMTASVADFENDGDLDVYFTNTGVSGKKPKLLVNNSDGTFSEQGEAWAVQLEHWSWGAVWFDFNNNGLQDLYVCTGDPSTIAAQQPNYFFRNNGDIFEEANDVFPAVTALRSFSVARGDVNNDGYYDLAVSNRFPNNAYLWENNGGENNYIKITLEGTVSNRQAIGSWIRVYAGGQTYTQWTLCGENYLGQNSQHHIFGLGNLSQVDSVSVHYNLGHTDWYYNLPVNANYYFVEGETYTASIVADGPLIQCDGSTIVLDAGEHANYLWSTGDTTQYLEVTASGGYAVTLTNPFGITTMASIEVDFTPIPQVNADVTFVSCNGLGDGSIELSNVSGVDVDEVIWSNGQSGVSVFGLTAGWYTYTFTDVNSCSTNGTVEVLQPELLQLDAAVEQATPESGGAVWAEVSGGVQPYTYYLNNALLSANGANDLDPGDYTLLVIDDNGCQVAFDFTLEVPDFVLESDGNGWVFDFDPVRNVVILASPNRDAEHTCQLFTASGRLVLSRDFAHQDEIVLPSNLSAGVYILVISTEGSIVRFRFLAN